MNAEALAGPQVHLSYAVPRAALNARALRVDIFRAAILPREVFQGLAFTGHRDAFNLVALTPAGNAVKDFAAEIGLWLANKTGHFAALRVGREGVSLTPTSRPYTYHLNSLLLLRSGKQWTKASDPSWVQARVEATFKKGLAEFASTWQCDGSALQPQLEITGRVLPISLPVTQPQGLTSVLVVSAIHVRLHAQLSGIWHLGGMPGLGLGRLSYAGRSASPAQVDAENASRGALMSVEAQLSILS